MFRGHVFIAAPDVSEDIRLLVAACGGRVVSSFGASVTLGLVVKGRQEKLNCAARLRGLRIPILRTSWVRASAAAGCMLPMKYPHAEYDPELFESLCFTTTMLPADVKMNVIGVIQFFGGSYSPHFTTVTNILLYGDGDLKSSVKWRSAWERAIPCVSVSWLQECIYTGRRCPLPSLPSAIAVTCKGTEEEKEEDEDSCNSSCEAARGKCSFSLHNHQKRFHTDADDTALF